MEEKEKSSFTNDVDKALLKRLEQYLFAYFGTIRGVKVFSYEAEFGDEEVEL